MKKESTGDLPPNDTPPRRRGRPASAASEGGEVQSLDRAIALLEVLATGEGLTLSDVARRAELPPSTVHRLLMTLHRRGLVGHEVDTGLWTVGVGLFRIGAAYLRIRKLPEIARPLLRALQSEVDETVDLRMLDQNDLVCVAQAESHAPMRAFFRLGRRMPLHACAAGKAILAAAPDAWRTRLLGPEPFERFTPATHTSVAALVPELEAVRTRGWAIDDEEYTPGLRCVSAAVLNEWGEPAGSVSISAPAVRMPPDRLLLLGERVQGTARTLSALYSGRSPG